MPSTDVQRLCAGLLYRLDTAHPGMIPVVVLLLTLMCLAAAVLILAGGVVGGLNRLLQASLTVGTRQPRTEVAP